MKSRESAGGTKRYNLVLPEELFNQLQEVANRKHTTVLELIRKFVKLGLIAVQAEDTPGTEFLLRENGIEQRILIL